MDVTPQGIAAESGKGFGEIVIDDFPIFCAIPRISIA